MKQHSKKLISSVLSLIAAKNITSFETILSPEQSTSHPDHLRQTQTILGADLESLQTTFLNVKGPCKAMHHYAAVQRLDAETIRPEILAIHAQLHAHFRPLA